jgi:hypothetical protein
MACHSAEGEAMPEFPNDEKQTELVNMLTEGLVQYEKALKATGLKTKWSNFLLRAVLRVACYLNFDDQMAGENDVPLANPPVPNVDHAIQMLREEWEKFMEAYE